MITFKCDRCGYELTFPRTRVTVDLYKEGTGYDKLCDLCDYRIHGHINSDERAFSMIESVHGNFLLCSECKDEYPKVVQDAIDNATITFIKENK